MITRSIADLRPREQLYAILIDYIHWVYSGVLGPPLAVAATQETRNSILASRDYPDCVQWDPLYVSEVPGSSVLKLSLDEEFFLHCNEIDNAIDDEDRQAPRMLRNLVRRLVGLTR